MKRPTWAAAVLLLLAGAVTCSSPPTPLRIAPPLGLDEFYAVPEDNPLTPAKVELGRRLFFDPVLSSDRRRACASCHRPERAFSDGVPRSEGVYQRVARRNTPSLLNVGYSDVLSWDGRQVSLEEQVLRPLGDSLEFDLPLERLEARLLMDASYRQAFERAFGAPPSGPLMGRALASYLRTLRSGDSPLDRYRAGEPEALSATEKRGLDLFLGRANCTACHLGPLLTDEAFHNTGVSWGGSDLGREGVTGRAADRGLFNTPSLRNVACTAPYMHDGSVATLREVVDFYDRGGGPNPGLDPELRPLRLARAERTALVAFLQALGDDGC